MPADIVTMEDCASNYGVYEVKGSKGNVYQVSFNGSEGQAYCTCPAWQFNRNSPEAKTCKHVVEVYDNACMYNAQWHDGNENPIYRPEEYTYDAFTAGRCKCGEPLVAVRRAV